MENRGPEPVPFIVHESMVARQERTIKRLWILCLVIFLAFVGSNAAWIWYESQFEEQEIVQAVLQDSEDGGTNTYHGNIIGGDLNGETGSDYESEKESS
jgi:cytoskeletal protein RodZ